MDPLIEQENRQEAVIKGIDKIMSAEEARQRWASDMEFSRLPLWLQERLEGDRAWDGSDLQGWDMEEFDE